MTGVPTAAEEGSAQAMRDVLDFIDSYYGGAGGHDVESYADWFHHPTIIEASALPGAIRSDELMVLHSSEDILAWRQKMLEAYKDISFGSLSASVRSVRLLTSDIAMFVGDVRRARIDGSEINISSHLYIIVRRDQAWRILVTLPASNVDTTC